MLASFLAGPASFTPVLRLWGAATPAQRRAGFVANPRKASETQPFETIAGQPPSEASVPQAAADRDEPQFVGSATLTPRPRFVSILRL